MKQKWKRRAHLRKRDLRYEWKVKRRKEGKGEVKKRVDAKYKKQIR